MALTDIYVLPSDYPTFDWADWPDSKAALVSGGYTHDFEKECWNAIIDLLVAALTDAGLSWDSLYTTAAAAKITQSYGDLYAAVFNSVRNNIDFPMPIGWAWAENPNFRGYVGREDFRGVSIWGESQADDVYAEYIPELVRKLNLLIGVMTGEAAKVMQGQGLVETLHNSQLLAKPSYPLAGIGQGYSLSRANGRALPSRALFVGEMIQSDYNARLRARIAAVLGQHLYLGKTDYKATAKRTRAGNLGGHEYILKSLMAADMDIYNARPIAAKWLSRSKQGGTMAQFPPFPMSAEWLSNSLYSATGAAPLGYLLSGVDKSRSDCSGDIVQVESFPVAAKERAKTLFSAVPFKLGIAPMEFGKKVVSIHSAALKRAVDMGGKAKSATLVSAVLYLQLPDMWYDPVQTGSNLYIISEAFGAVGVMQTICKSIRWSFTPLFVMVPISISGAHGAAIRIRTKSILIWTCFINLFRAMEICISGAPTPSGQMGIRATWTRTISLTRYRPGVIFTSGRMC